MKELTHIESLENGDQIYRPTLQYALLKYALFPILGIVLKFGLTMIPVNNLYEANVFIGLGKVLLIVFLLVYGYKVLYLCNTKFSFQDEHLEITKGVFSIQNDYVQYYRIKDLKRFRSFVARLIGTMDVTLITSDKFNRSIILSGISNNRNFANELRGLIEKERLNKRVFEVD
tara:strand:- start:46764 stop:47282 length:519 start_codon:yes stop_codon:yes gene_type:complete